MPTTTRTIAAELRLVFPATWSKTRLSLVNNSMDYEASEVAEEFADKADWTKLAPEFLDAVPNGLGSALSFLSDEAICFYIPAFILADLEGHLDRADPAFHLCHGFTDLSRDHRIRPRSEETWTDYSRARWASLTKDQAAAVVHYLEWCIERDGPNIAHGCVEALKAYWYEAASGAGRTSEA